MLWAKQTHVYVNNCTPLNFKVDIEYENLTGKKKLNLDKPFFIQPYDNLSDPQNMVLKINRFLPEGEHYYTIKLIHGVDTLYLKQNCVSLSGAIISDLGISLSGPCIQDPWYMNDQAKKKHEHLLSIDGHTITVIYYAFGNNGNEDIKYSLYEKLPVPSELKKCAILCGKTLAYHLVLPIISGNAHLESKITKLLMNSVHVYNDSSSELMHTKSFLGLNPITKVVHTSYFLEQSLQQEECLTTAQPMLTPYLANPLIKLNQYETLYEPLHRPNPETSLHEWLAPRMRCNIPCNELLTSPNLTVAT
jgi:hypothetical protein